MLQYKAEWYFQVPTTMQDIKTTLVTIWGRMLFPCSNNNARYKNNPRYNIRQNAISKFNNNERYKNNPLDNISSSSSVAVVVVVVVVGQTVWPISSNQLLAKQLIASQATSP